MQDGRSMYVGCEKLNKITIGDTFRYDTTTRDSTAYYYLPTPDPKKYGQDGNWYKDEDGTAYAPQDVPNGGKGTYLVNEYMIPYAYFKLCFKTISDDTDTENQNTNSDLGITAYVMNKNISDPYPNSKYVYNPTDKSRLDIRSPFNCIGTGTISCRIFYSKNDSNILLKSLSYQVDSSCFSSNSYGMWDYSGNTFYLKNTVPIGSTLYAEVTINDTELNQEITFYTNNVIVTKGMTSTNLESIRYSKSTS